MSAKSVFAALALSLAAVTAASAGTVVKQQITKTDDFGTRITKTRVLATDDFGNRVVKASIRRTDIFGNTVKITRTVKSDVFGSGLTSVQVGFRSNAGF